MEAYFIFHIGNFIELPASKQDYCVYNFGKGQHIIVASWLSALHKGGSLCAIIGICLAGPLTSCITTISGLMLLNVFVFVFYLPIRFLLYSCRSLRGHFMANLYYQHTDIL